ncbi:chloride channel protein [Flexithrix dorotheae]|uniref:chloride channel protein n=1 Tax=Flexithrix dorotheae TaxID=70993 RepID=UPI00035E791E|nr:chloride channel protein [Flexithrix dorotheae]
MGLSDKLERALTWNIKYISERNFVLIISGIVGIVSGLAAVILKEAVHYIHHFLTSQDFTENYVQILYPVIGLFFTILLAKALYREEQLGHAITDILYSIAKKSSVIGKSKTYSRMITSAFTVGFGGSAGLESPIVLTGSAIGSNIAQLVNFNYKLRTLMIGCGTAGVISAIFNAPVAGLIFSMEVILIDVSVSSFIPLLSASVSATLVSLVLLGEDVLFSFKLVDTFNAFDTPLYIALGILCGITSKTFLKVLHATEDLFEKLKNQYSRVLIGGALLSLTIFLVPPVFGEGYSIIKALLNNNHDPILDRSIFFDGKEINDWIFLGYLVVIIIFKFVASSLTIGSGGSGGTFAPSMFLGGVTGFAFATLVNLTGFAYISESNFALVGMCGVLCGVQYAPLTAIFLIAELTGGYVLFIPLMIVSAISYSTVSFNNPISPYVTELYKRGEYAADDHDKKILNHLSIHSLIERDFKKIHQSAILEDLIKVISKSKRNIFPVLNGQNELTGIVTLDDVREIMFDGEKQKKVKISEIMNIPPAYIEYDEDMASVMQKFETANAWNLPVLKNGKYEGFISKSRIFNVYRKQLVGKKR